MSTSPPNKALSEALANAVAYLGAGRVAEADAILAKAREAWPANPDVLQLSGAAAKRAGRLPEAVDFMERSLQVNPRQPAVWNNLGGAFLAMGRRDDAIAAFEKAVSLQPDYFQAAQNLGVALTQAGRNADAIAVLQRTVNRAPPSAALFEALGYANAQQGDPAAALPFYDRALAMQPDRASIHHNRGAALQAVGRTEEALQSLRIAAALAPASAETAFALANTLLCADRREESVVWFEKTVALDPGHLFAHDMLNENLWQTGKPERYAASYGPALNHRPADNALRLQFAATLKKMGQAEGAAEQAREVLRRDASSSAAHDLLASALFGLGRYDEAEEASRRAIQIAPDDAAIQGRRSEILLRMARYGDAIDVLRSLVDRSPLDQENIARLSVAYRCAGEAAAHLAFADPQSLAVVQQLEPPEGFKDIESFNRVLAGRLRSLHTAKQHPTDQTLRGGTQTLGSLFASQDPLIQQLKVQLEKAIAKVVGAMPDRSAHPFYQRKSSQFRFAGSWSVLLKTQGFHTNHIHPMGWISSAYYINLPEEVDGGGHDGWFKIGETNPDTLPALPVERWVKPRSGSLVLFPSYMWHGTQAFDRSAERLTVAFDVVPE